MKRIKAIDWKFWLALSLAVLVGYLAFVGYAAVEDGREKDRQINSLIRATEAKDDAAERARVTADRERAVAASNQAALLDYTRSLAVRQRALLEYLRANGIDIPVRYVTEIVPPKIVQQSAPKRTTKRAPTDRTRGRVNLPGKSERGRDNGKGRP